jgi:aminopeptidase N
MAILILILVLGAASLQASPVDEVVPSTVHDGADRCSRAKAARAGLSEEAARLKLKSSSDPLSEQTDVLHYKLDFEIDPVARYLDGGNTMTVKAVVDGVAVFRFWLHSAMSITEIRVDGRVAAWRRLDTEAIEVELGHSFSRDEIFELEIQYEGSPETAGLMSIVFEEQFGSPVVSTLSEPWFSYTWWPVKEDSRDKATGELLITVPDELTVVSNGVLVGVDTVGAGKDRYHWSTDYPMSPYLFAFSATRYSSFTDNYLHPTGVMPVEFYLYPDSDTSQNRALWRLSVDMLATFGDLYGLYPFIDEKYAIYQFPWGGGMEHQTATGQGGFWEDLTAHELAHQWWGDMVTCATWSDIWLNEGFATYSEALWTEFKSGVSNPSALRAAMSQRRPYLLDGTVYVHDSSNVSRIFSSNYSYRKGAWVLHMLRGLVGDEVFFATLEAYRDRYEYRTATTDDFREIAEEVWGGDLRWFFDQWVYGGGAPAYRFGWHEHEVDGQRYLEVSLAQTQDESAFEMPLTIETIEHGQRRRYAVWNDERNEHFLIPVSAPVDAFDLDPDVSVLARSETMVAFTEGPPRIVDAGITLDRRAHPAASRSIEVTFHEDVIVDGSHFVLRRADGSAVDVELSYDSGTFTATLKSREELGFGHFELTVDDAIVDVAAGLALDGEIDASNGQARLPSGDGVAGGKAVIELEITASRRPTRRAAPSLR